MQIYLKGEKNIIQACYSSLPFWNTSLATLDEKSLPKKKKTLTTLHATKFL